MLESHLDLIRSLTKGIQKLEKTIEDRVGSLLETQLLMTIPGVGLPTTLTIHAELGDISRFDGDKAVDSYIELNPAIRGSGDSRTEGIILGRGRVRWLPVQAANAAVHSSEITRSFLANRSADLFDSLAFAKEVVIEFIESPSHGIASVMRPIRRSRLDFETQKILSYIQSTSDRTRFVEHVEAVLQILADFIICTLIVSHQAELVEAVGDAAPVVSFSTLFESVFLFSPRISIFPTATIRMSSITDCARVLCV